MFPFYVDCLEQKGNPEENKKRKTWFLSFSCSETMTKLKQSHLGLTACAAV